MITVALLRQAGASADLIARVCELDQADEIERKNTRRAQNRTASRAYRERQKTKLNQQPRHPRQHDENDAPPANNFLNEINGLVINNHADDSPQTPLETQSQITESETRGESSRVRAQIPPLDWRPNSGTLMWADQKGWTPNEVDAARERYLAHANAVGREINDFDAGLRSWMLKFPPQSKGQSNGYQQEPRPYSREWRRERYAAALDKLSDFARGGSGADPLSPEWLPDSSTS